MKDDAALPPSPLWRTLDLMLEASAIALQSDPEVAGYAMMAALAIGDRVGLSDKSLYAMRESAVAELRNWGSKSPVI